jgi:hypothetical protein
MSGDFKFKRTPKSRMMYFSDKKKDLANMNKRPRTLRDMKNLQSFVQSKVSTPGESLTDSIQKQAVRDESFNDFLKE